MTRPVIVLAAVLALPACGDSTDAATPDAGTNADAAPNAAARYFEHPFFDDPADCPDDPLFNCTADFELCDDGRAVMLVTDIINSGTYAETAGEIRTTWDAGDVPNAIVFTVRSETSLVDDWNGWTWTAASTAFSFCD